MFERDGVDECKRSEDRRAVALEAVVLRRDGSRARAELSDLSYGGCRISDSDSLEPAERIRLVVPKLGQIEAQVRWASRDGAGAQFGGGGPWRRASDLATRGARGHVRHFNFGSRRSFGRKGQAA